MTQVAIFNKAKLPKLKKLERDIQSIGYDFKVSDSTETILTQDGIECLINGQKTFFETYVDEPKNLIKESGFIEPDYENEDTVLSFVWGANFAAGACIGLISLALIDNCNAKIYYLDDEIKYTREMLMADTPQFLDELKKQTKTKSGSETKNAESKAESKKGFWSKLKDKLK